MILIRPMNDVRHPATDVDRHHINYRLAELLKDYIILKGDECMLTRESEDAANKLWMSFENKYDIPVYITIDMYADFDANASGYDILCDTYNSLVATFNYELFKLNRKPIRDLGYKVTGAARASKYSDITLYLGYATNATELDWWKDEANLDLVAKRLTEGAYGPPVKTIEDTDATGNDDPYFYKIDAWKESQEIDGCSAEIAETTYTGLPLRYISINSVAETGEYTWEIPNTYEKETMCIFIGSLRSHGSSPTCYIKIGNTEYTDVVSDTTFSIKVFEGTVGTGTPIKLGVKGKGRIDYSGIWVAPKGSMGALDDPRTDYSIFPPGYRPVNKVTSAYASADSIHIALTTAHTLIERAQDVQSGPVTTTAVVLDASKGIASDRSSSTDIGNIINSGISVALKVANYAAALTAIMDIFGNNSPQDSATTDATKQKVDFAALQSAVGAVRSFEDKAKIQASVNDMEGVNTAVISAIDGDNQAAETATLALKDTATPKEKLESGETKPDPNSASPIDAAKEKVAQVTKYENATLVITTSDKESAWAPIKSWTEGKLLVNISADAVDDDTHQVTSLYGVDYSSFKEAAGDIEDYLKSMFNTWANQMREYQAALNPPPVPEGETPPEPVEPIPPSPDWTAIRASIGTSISLTEAAQLNCIAVQMPQALLSAYGTAIGRAESDISNINAVGRFIEARNLGGAYNLQSSGTPLASSYVLRDLVQRKV